MKETSLRNGLRIKTFDGREFDVFGTVRYKPDYGVYYCKGSSFSADIVAELYGEVHEVPADFPC